MPEPTIGPARRGAIRYDTAGNPIFRVPGTYVNWITKCSGSIIENEIT
jgi:hypothetical protein